jgi:signal transduction histidine kinase
VCTHLADLLEALGHGAGALLVADEAIKGDFLHAVAGVVQYQPGWSDLPVLVMTRKGAEAPDAQARYLQLGNVSLLERPVQGITLLSAVRSALRARRRQYAMRDADRRKDEFLAMLAHELRNPLAPIRAAADLLHMATPDEARVRQASEVIGRQVKHMTELVDDLLDLSRVSRGLVTLDQALIDARIVIDSAVEQVGPLLESRRHRLTIRTCGEAAFVQGDQKRLVQIVANILHNAAKYTPEGGDIALALDAGRDRVTFSVADNGAGIAPNVIDHIFDMFAQAQRTPDRAEGGLGIGLALVRNLVTLHGGQVSASSAGVGQGSRFTVALPRVASAGSDAAAGPAQPSTQAPRARRVLVVDDNRDAGDMLGLLLARSLHVPGRDAR